MVFKYMAEQYNDGNKGWRVIKLLGPGFHSDKSKEHQRWESIQEDMNESNAKTLADKYNNQKGISEGQ